MGKEERIKKYWNNIKVLDVEGEKIYFSKDKLGWHFVAPIYHLETGKPNWKNIIFGTSITRFIATWVFIAILLLGLFEYVNVLNVANECLAKLPDYLPILT